MRPRRTRMVSSSTSHSFPLSLAHGPGKLLPVALSPQRRPPSASPRAHRLLVPAPHRLPAPAMADPPDPTLATADPAAPTSAMADRALAMVDPTVLAPGMAPAMTCYRRASRYSASSSTAGTEGLRRALGRETELPNPNVSYFLLSVPQIYASVRLASSRPLRRDPIHPAWPRRVCPSLRTRGATVSVPRATVCCLRI
jgi:hypothetical protein